MKTKSIKQNDYTTTTTAKNDKSCCHRTNNDDELQTKCSYLLILALVFKF